MAYIYIVHAPHSSLSLGDPFDSHVPITPVALDRLTTLDSQHHYHQPATSTNNTQQMMSPQLKQPTLPNSHQVRSPARRLRRGYTTGSLDGVHRANSDRQRARLGGRRQPELCNVPLYVASGPTHPSLVSYAIYTYREGWLAGNARSLAHRVDRRARPRATVREVLPSGVLSGEGCQVHQPAALLRGLLLAVQAGGGEALVWQ